MPLMVSNYARKMIVPKMFIFFLDNFKILVLLYPAEIIGGTDLNQAMFLLAARSPAVSPAEDIAAVFHKG